MFPCRDMFFTTNIQDHSVFEPSARFLVYFKVFRTDDAHSYTIRRNCNPDIHISCCPRIAVIAHRKAADQQIFGLMEVQQFQKFSEGLAVSGSYP